MMKRFDSHCHVCDLHDVKSRPGLLKLCCNKRELETWKNFTSYIKIWADSCFKRESADKTDVKTHRVKYRKLIKLVVKVCYCYNDGMMSTIKYLTVTHFVASGGEELEGGETTNFKFFYFVSSRVHLCNNNIFVVFETSAKFIPSWCERFAVATPRSVC